MTESYSMKLLPSDFSYNFGSLMLRLLPSEDTGQQDLFSSILKLLCYNRALVSGAPKFENTRKFKFRSIFRGQNMMQKFIIEFSAFVTKREYGLTFSGKENLRSSNSFIKNSLFRIHCRI